MWLLLEVAEQEMVSAGGGGGAGGFRESHEMYQ